MQTDVRDECWLAGERPCGYVRGLNLIATGGHVWLAT